MWVFLIIIIVPDWKQPRCSSVDEMNKLLYPYNGMPFSEKEWAQAIQKYKWILNGYSWVKGKSQSEKAAYYVIPVYMTFWKRQDYRNDK